MNGMRSSISVLPTGKVNDDLEDREMISSSSVDRGAKVFKSHVKQPNFSEMGSLPSPL